MRISEGMDLSFVVGSDRTSLLIRTLRMGFAGEFFDLG
jgi:hypothetical protein